MNKDPLVHESETDAYRRGRHDRQDGARVDECPIHGDADQAQEWMDGWMDEDALKPVVVMKIKQKMPRLISHETYAASGRSSKAVVSIRPWAASASACN